MMGLLIALAVLVALGLLPVGIWVYYNNGDLTVKIPVWLWKITVHPRKPKKAKKPKKKEKPKKKMEIPVEISVESVLELLEILWNFVRKTGRRLRVQEVDLQVVCGGGNAATVALDYGKICAIVSSTEPLFDSVFRVKQKNIQVDLDFEAKSQSTVGTIDIRLCLASLLYLVAFLAKHGFTFYRKRKKAA